MTNKILMYLAIGVGLILAVFAALELHAWNQTRMIMKLQRQVDAANGGNEGM